MFDVFAAVDSATGAFGPLVQNRLHADMQTAINAGVSAAMSAQPAFVDAVAARTTDNLVSPLLATATATRNSLDARYRNHLWFDVTAYGAVGDGVADDTAAVQAAVNAALAATDPIYVEKPVFNGQSPTLFFPLGTYNVDQITIAGTMNILGVGGGLYAASVLQQRSDGQNILFFTADTDGQSNATMIEYMTFKSRSSTRSTAVAQIKTDPTAGGVNSVYIRNCWFKTPENLSIWYTRGGDIQITGCTFDVSAFGSIKLGDIDSNRQSGDCRITNNTFFNITLNCIELSYTQNTIISANSYGNGSEGRDPTYATFVQIMSRLCENTVISANTIDGPNKFVGVYVFGGNFGGLNVHGNIGHVIRNILKIEGDGIAYGINMTGNTIGADSNNGVSLPEGAFTAIGTGVQGSAIALNSVTPDGSATRMFNMPDSRVLDNKFTLNPAQRFAANNNFANPTANGV